MEQLVDSAAQPFTVGVRPQAWQAKWTLERADAFS